jgi:serine/threonine protein kinase
MERRIEQMSFDRKRLLGMGSFGAVFVGSLNGREVAVKRIQLSFVTMHMQREEEINFRLKHPNVIELLDVKEDDDFR